MNRRDVSFTFALCASLVAHALLSIAAVELYVRDVGSRIFTPPLTRAAPEVERAMLGDAGGVGEATDASPGERQLLARAGIQDQPFLSCDPVGPGIVGDDPSFSTVPPGDGEPRVAPPPLPAPAFAATEEPGPVGMPAAPEVQPVEPATDDENGDLATSHAIPLVAVAPLAAHGPPEIETQQTMNPGVAAPAADPAPLGESESDPVSVVGTLDLRAGSTDVRGGRRHRIVRPRLTLDAKMDLVSLGSTRLVLRLRLDAAGNVVSSHVVRSSGSKSVDQIVKVTSYEWWFEPARDASGLLITTPFDFAVRIN